MLFSELHLHVVLTVLASNALTCNSHRAPDLNFADCALVTLRVNACSGHESRKGMLFRGTLHIVLQPEWVAHVSSGCIKSTTLVSH